MAHAVAKTPSLLADEQAERDAERHGIERGCAD